MSFLYNKKKSFLIVLALSLSVFYILLNQNENKVFIRLSHKFGLLLKQTGDYVDSVDFDPDNVPTQYSIVNLSDIKQSVSNIFFVESTCATEKLLESSVPTHNFLLNPRQCCAVESTANNNRNRTVYIIHTCPLDPNFNTRIPKFAHKVLSHPNVHIVRYNITEMFDGTPVQDLIRSKRIENTDNPVEHSSDVLRFTVLWKFGGTYLDLDVVSIKSFDQLGSNFCGRELGDFYVGSAILNFEPTGHGHDLMTRALEFSNKHFTGDVWTANGPDLITKIAKEECGTLISELPSCRTLKVYDPDYFFPVPFHKHSSLFNNTEGPAVVAQLKNMSFTVHMWNKLTKHLFIRINSTQGYGLLADEFCPDVYRNCGDYF